MNFDTLKTTFKGVITSPSDGDDYKINRWATNAEKPAKFVVYPVDAQDIANTILFARFEKKSGPFPLAIAGGRHGSSGASSSDGGIVIDMRNMNDVRVDKDNMIVYAGGGTLARQVAEVTFPLGLSTTFPFGGDIGFIGFVLGGGIGFHMGERGLGLDNLVSAKVVLANGDIVTTSKDEHPDLFWGIRGGGSNFGVVAEIGMKLFEQRQTFYHAEYSFAREQLPSLISAVNNWQKVQNPREFFYFEFLPFEPHIFLSCFSNSGPDGQTMSKFFQAVGPKSTLEISEEPIGSMFGIGEPFCAIGGPKLLQGAHINSFDYETVAQVFDEYLALIKKAPGSVLMYEFSSYKKAAEVPTEATAFSHRTTDTVVLTATIGFDGELFKVQTASRDLVKLISSSSSSTARASLGYPNYADAYANLSDSTDSARRLFGVNYERLQAVKRMYDPETVFSQWFNVLPS